MEDKSRAPLAEVGCGGVASALQWPWASEPQGSVEHTGKPLSLGPVWQLLPKSVLGKKSHAPPVISPSLIPIFKTSGCMLFLPSSPWRHHETAQRRAGTRTGVEVHGVETGAVPSAPAPPPRDCSELSER